MKSYIKISGLLLSVAFLAILTSCEKEEMTEVAMGKLELSIAVGEDLKSALTDSNDITTYHVLLSVVNSLGELILDDELIPLYRFGNQFISEKIEIKSGRHQLVKFMVLDPYGQVVYASPLEGSPFAYLVNDPLPMAFSILPGENTMISPEVLAVRNSDPGDFGYASFSVQVVQPLPFYIMAVIDDPMLMAPIVITDATLSVTSPDGWSYRFYLEARVNRIVIRGGVPYYTLVVKKEGLDPKRIEIQAERLKATTMEEPLIIRLSRLSSHVLTLQPGPEDGMDAMITNRDPNENFGNHPNFEATFLSDSILTVMYSSKSLIRFHPNELPKDARIEKVMMTLHFDPAFPWDSIYYDSLIYYADPASSSFAWYGAVLQQVVEPWEEQKVTWENQPASIEANQVYISPIVYGTNFLRINVTSLFIPMQEIAAPNYGMMLRLWPSEQFPGFSFISSDHPVPEFRPKLEIHYSIQRD